MLSWRAPYPLAVFQEPSVLEVRALAPLAVFSSPVVMEARAWSPILVLVPLSRTVSKTHASASSRDGTGAVPVAAWSAAICPACAVIVACSAWT